MSDKIGRFTPRARRVLGLAQETAEGFQHGAIGTEHVLLGFIKEDGGVAAHLLRELQIDAKAIHKIVSEMKQDGERPPTVGSTTLAPQTKQMLELAVEEARRLDVKFVGTEHLLFGIIMQEDSTALGILKRFGVQSEQIRQQLQRVFDSYSLSDLAPLLPFPDTLLPLTEQSKRVIFLSQRAARELHHNHIRAEHLLLGILRELQGVGAQVLHNLGVMPEQVEKLVVTFTVNVTPEPSTLEYAPVFNRVLELAAEEARSLQTARRLKEHLIGTEHLLLALARHKEGMVLDILKQLGVSPEEIRRQTRRVLQRSLPQTPAPSALDASRLIPRTLPPEAHQLLEKVVLKTLDMVDNDKLTQAQAVELIQTLSSNLQPDYVRLASLISMWFDKRKYEGFKVQLTLSDANGVEIIEDATLPFFTLLGEIDRFAAAVYSHPQTPLVFKLGGSSLEIRLERIDDSSNKAVL